LLSHFTGPTGPSLHHTPDANLPFTALITRLESASMPRFVFGVDCADVLEYKLATTPEAMKQVFDSMPR
jgi:hypothetical protein